MSIRGLRPDKGAPVVSAHPSSESFESFYRREFKNVVALAYALSGSRHGAEDLAQEGFLAAHRRWNEIARYDDPRAWVRRVVTNQCASLVRRRVAEGKALARLASHRQAIPAPISHDSSDYWRAVRALPKRQAQVVALYYLFERSVLEVAQTLDIAEGTVKAHLHKARHALAQKLNIPEDEA